MITTAEKRKTGRCIGDWRGVAKEGDVGTGEGSVAGAARPSGAGTGTPEAQRRRKHGPSSAREPQEIGGRDEQEWARNGRIGPCSFASGKVGKLPAAHGRAVPQDPSDLQRMNPEHRSVMQSLSSAYLPLGPRLREPKDPATLLHRLTGCLVQLQEVATLRLCRMVLSCLAFCAVYAFLSWGTAPGAPFASAAMAMGETSASGLTSTAKSAWAGLAAGFLHTLCGPDHLAALTPLTIGRDRVAASALGALWGFGHSNGQLILGLVFVVLKERFHDFVPFLDRWAGIVVPLTLIAIGLMGIYESFFEAKEEGGHHAEEEAAAINLALAADGASVPAAGGKTAATGLQAGFATYATGIVHGLQPDALFVVIPALALPTKLAAIAYCTMLVTGTVSAMGGYTLLIGTTSQALIKEQPWLEKHLSTVAAGIAIVVGALMLAAGLGVEVPFFY